MRVWGLTLGAVLTAAAMLPAAPLDVKEVSEKAQWVAHLDADALRGSTVFQKALASEQGRQLPPPLAKALADLKFDLAKDLHAATIYGMKLGSPEAAILVHADVDRELLAGKIKTAPEYKAAKHGDHDIHLFKSPRNNRTVAAALLPDVLAVADSEQTLGTALDVLDGKSPALTKDSPLAAESPKGAIVVARAVKVGEAELPLKSPLVQQSDSIALAVGENETQVFAEGKVLAKSADVAKQLKGVVDGVRTTAELRRGDDPDVRKLIDALKIDTADNQLRVEIRLPVDDTLAIMKKAGAVARNRFRARLDRDQENK